MSGRWVQDGPREQRRRHLASIIIIMSRIIQLRLCRCRATLKWCLMWCNGCTTRNRSRRICWQPWRGYGRTVAFKSVSHEATNINWTIRPNSKWTHSLFITGSSIYKCFIRHGNIYYTLTHMLFDLCTMVNYGAFNTGRNLRCQKLTIRYNIMTIRNGGSNCHILQCLY